MQTRVNSPADALRHRRETSASPLLQVKQWDLIALAAEGTWATIHRARPTGSPADRPATYAVKMLQPSRQEDPQAINLLRREAEVGRSISHPHVVSVLSASVSQPPYLIVMPWLSGTTLKARLAAQSPLEVHTALWIARQAAMGLEGLDRGGWMHGDVKPGNIFVSPEGHVTLLDLGFARRDTQPGSARHRCVMGTCTHIAPEMLATSIPADIRADIYSLGVVLYEALAGRLPFEADDLPSLALQHRQAVPPPMRQVAPHVPADVAALVHQMLAKDPLRRPATPSELVDRLTALELDALAARYAA
jgi:serine/threonine-protein kinase